LNIHATDISYLLDNKEYKIIFYQGRVECLCMPYWFFLGRLEWRGTFATINNIIQVLMLILGTNSCHDFPLHIAGERISINEWRGLSSFLIHHNCST